MPRRARVAPGGRIYHVLNRSNASFKLFRTDKDYAAFDRVLEEAHQREPRVKVLGWCVMPTHWHLVLWPAERVRLSEFVRWLTVTHAQRYRAAKHSQGKGHVYQGRFKSFPVQDDRHFLVLLRYVERNALRAGLVQRAEEWRWGSLWRREHGTDEQRAILSDWPVPRPRDWLAWVNRPQTAAEEEAVQTSIRRSRPFGSDDWTLRTARELKLQWTLNPRGRPGKRANGGGRQCARRNNGGKDSRPL